MRTRAEDLTPERGTKGDSFNKGHKKRLVSKSFKSGRVELNQREKKEREESGLSLSY